MISFEAEGAVPMRAIKRSWRERYAGRQKETRPVAHFSESKEPLDVEPLTLINRSGHRVTLNTLGASMTGVYVPDRTGALTNICAEAGGSSGKIIGRYANRIARGMFTLDGIVYTLLKNEGRNTLHGGPDGFSKRSWGITEQSETSIAFGLSSPDGDQGFPGAFDCGVRYTWSDDDALRIDYAAVTNKPTVVNFTNHVYFNLAGNVAEPVAGYHLQIPASEYTPLDTESIPTGEISPVDELRDFRVAREVGSTPYDINFVLDDWDGTLRHAATLFDPASSRAIVVTTTQPGMQLFTGKPGAIALETQHFADAPNHPNFPNTVLRPGETFTAVTVYRFGVLKSSV